MRVGRLAWDAQGDQATRPTSETKIFFVCFELFNKTETELHNYMSGTLMPASYAENCSVILKGFTKYHQDFFSKCVIIGHKVF